MMKRIVIAILMTLVSAQAACAELVYDFISVQLYTGGSGFNNIYEVGDTITLAGTARIVTDFEMIFNTGVPPTDIRFNFYEINKTGDEIVSLIWSSPLIARTSAHSFTASTPIGTKTFYSYTIDVPDVLVPNQFVWTVENL